MNERTRWWKLLNILGFKRIAYDNILGRCEIVGEGTDYYRPRVMKNNGCTVFTDWVNKKDEPERISHIHWHMGATIPAIAMITLIIAVPTVEGKVVAAIGVLIARSCLNMLLYARSR